MKQTAKRTAYRLWAWLVAASLFAIALPAGALDVELSGEPSRGPADAPVTVIMFYDFQCGHCKKTGPVLLEAVGQYGDLVRLVMVNVPAPGNPYAEPSAELALTAHDHGKFWEAFDLLFANQDKLAPEDLVGYGVKLGLDEKLVRGNLDKHVHRELIKRDFYQALDLGVTATPTIFINETKSVGYKKADVFKYHINAELAKKGIKSPVGEVAKPAEDKPDVPEVPREMIFAVRPQAPLDSKLLVEIGDPAPVFSLPTIDGEKVDIAGFKGNKNVVLSFVPAAWTPVCSAQWPEYNENKAVFDRTDTALIGISADNVPSLFAWCGTMGDLWFPVASDFYPHGEVARRYGVLRSNGVTERAVFVIDKKGILRYIDVHDINSKPDFEVLKKELEKLAK